jgi:hypothetical protein
MAQLDNGDRRPFHVGEEQRDWIENGILDETGPRSEDSVPR